jgi:hypothetical protein
LNMCRSCLHTRHHWYWTGWWLTSSPS